MADSALNVSLRCLKLIVENAERELPERELDMLRSILLVAVRADGQTRERGPPLTGRVRIEQHEQDRRVDTG